MAWCFIVADAGSLTAAEVVVRTTAEAALGESVEIIDDTGIEPADISGKDVILSFSPSSTSINTTIGAALRATNRTVITLSAGIGVIVIALALVDSRQVGTTVGTVEVPDTAFDGGAVGSARAWYVDGGAFGEPVDTTGRVGAGFVGIAAQTSDATRHAAFGYPAGSVLADDETAAGPRFYLDARSADQWETTGGGGAARAIFGAMLGGGSGTPTNPTITVFPQTTRAGVAVEIVARAQVAAGDEIASLTAAGPGVEGSPFTTGVGTDVARTELDYTPQLATVGVENVTITATTASGGSATANLPVTVLDSLRRQINPTVLTAGGAVAAIGGGSPAVATVADIPDTTDGISIPAESSGDNDNVVVLSLPTADAPPSGTGAAWLTLRLSDDATAPRDVLIEVVDTGGASAAAVRAGGGTPIGPPTTVEITSGEWIAVSEPLSTGDLAGVIAALPLGRVVVRLTVTSA